MNKSNLHNSPANGNDQSVGTTIKRIGFYRSANGKEYIDWHMGHKNRTVSFYFMKFLANGAVTDYSSENPDFDFDQFLKENTGYVKRQKGSYKISENTIELIFGEGEFAVKKLYTFLSPKIILDEDLEEYHHIMATLNG